MKAKPINRSTHWAYFSPDGYIQMRSIADTKKLSREMISKWETYTWKDYEEKGYFVQKIMVDIQIKK